MLPSLTLLPIPVDHSQVLDQMQPPSMPLSLLLSPRMLEDQQVHWHHKQRDELLLLVLLSLLLLLDIDNYYPQPAQQMELVLELKPAPRGGWEEAIGDWINLVNWIWDWRI